jgi:general secretion pathway protein K
VFFVGLLFLGIITSTALAIIVLTGNLREQAENFKDYLTAYHGSVSAVKVILKVLKDDKNDYDGEGDDWYGTKFYRYKDITISAYVVDECGKININRLKDQRIYEIALRLSYETNIPSELIDRLKEAVSEGKRFSSLSQVYDFVTDTEIPKTFSKYFTVYGSGKININSAPKEILEAIFEGETLAESIIEERPFKNVQEIKELPGMDEELYYAVLPILTTKCDYFSFKIFSTCGSAVSEVEGYLTRRKVLEWRIKR